jgi:hypothetical protein
MGIASFPLSVVFPSYVQKRFLLPFGAGEAFLRLPDEASFFFPQSQSRLVRPASFGPSRPKTGGCFSLVRKNRFAQENAELSSIYKHILPKAARLSARPSGRQAFRGETFRKEKGAILSFSAQGAPQAAAPSGKRQIGS